MADEQQDNETATDDAVRRAVALDAPPEEVWDAVTDPERLGRWLADVERIELEPGGEVRMRTPNGEPRTGWVEDVEPARRLTFWWPGEDGDGDATRVEIELEPLGNEATYVTVTETRPLAAIDYQAQQLWIDASGPTGTGPLALAA